MTISPGTLSKPSSIPTDFWTKACANRLSSRAIRFSMRLSIRRQPERCLRDSHDGHCIDKGQYTEVRAGPARPNRSFSTFRPNFIIVIIGSPLIIVKACKLPCKNRSNHLVRNVILDREILHQPCIDLRRKRRLLLRKQGSRELLVICERTFRQTRVNGISRPVLSRSRTSSPALYLLQYRGALPGLI